MKIHPNGNRFQVCDGSETLMVVDNYEEAQTYILERQAELKQVREQHWQQLQERRQQLESRRYWWVKSGDAGYEAVCAVCLGMRLHGQVNNMCGKATVYASGDEAPEGWRECNQEEKRDVVERILHEEFPVD